MRKLFLISFICLFAKAWAYDAQIDGIYYNFNGTAASVTSGNKDYTGEVVIPATVSYDGSTYDVTSIEEEGFMACTNLTKVVLPASITQIGARAFDYCPNLTNLVLPASVTQIGVYAFSGCESLTTMTIPDGVSIIEEGIFTMCKNLETVKLPSNAYRMDRAVFFGCNSLTSVELPINIERIEDYTFYGCSSLAAINIPILVESIGPLAFLDCTSLKKIEIPQRTTTIGDGAFAGCDNLSSINVNEGNWYYTSVDGVLYNKEKSSLLAYPAGKENASFTIPNSVTTIVNSAFNDCKNLVSIDIPSSVKSIGDGALSECKNLSSINVSADNTVYASADGILYSKDMSALLAYPAGKENTSFTIPNSVTTIVNSAFNDCKNLVSIDIPSSVKSIGDAALSGCKNLSSINVSAGNIAYASADGVLYSKDMSALLAYPAAKKTTSFTIPDNVTTIGEYAFSDCNNLTRVDIPTATTNFLGLAFAYCDNIQSVYIYKDKEVLLDVNGNTLFEFTYNSGVEHVLYVRKGMKELYEASVYQYIFTRIEEMTDEEAGIDDVDNGVKEAEIKAVYDINGRRQSGMQNGVNIIRYSDGSVRKVVKK